MCATSNSTSESILSVFFPRTTARSFTFALYRFPTSSIHASFLLSSGDAYAQGLL
jgi:hypothetical protein